MKNIILSAVLSALTFFGVLFLLNRNDEATQERTLPAVEIKAKNVPDETVREIQLPEVTIRAKRSKITSITLPEVVIIAPKHNA